MIEALREEFPGEVIVITRSNQSNCSSDGLCENHIVRQTNRYLGEDILIPRSNLDNCSFDGLCENPPISQMNSEPGTWAHSILALECARWCDPKLAIACNRFVLAARSVQSDGMEAIRRELASQAGRLEALEQNRGMAKLKPDAIPEKSALSRASDQLLRLVDKVIFRKDTDVEKWEGSADKLKAQLAPTGIPDGLDRFGAVFGKLLGNLAKKTARVKHDRNSRFNFWRISK